MTELVFLPLSGDQLRGWATDGVLPETPHGYAATPAMKEAFGLTDPEDAEYAALSIASVVGLAAHGERLVAVVSSGFAASEDEFGAVEVANLSYRQVTALFGEDSDAAPADAAAVAVRGMPLDQAWETPEVQSLLEERDLLWYGPGEWEVIVGR